MAAVLLNIELGKENVSFIEQSHTLSYTLLPYLNKITDYSFISDEVTPVVIPLLSSLILHLKDT